MLDKIKNRIQNLPWQQFKDVRYVGFLVFVVIVLLTSWSGVRVIETNYRLQRQIATIQEQNEVKELENANLKLENAYYESETYLELAARQQFGKGAPGEKLILIPRTVAYKYAPELPKSETETAPDIIDNRPTYLRNFQAWMDFFFHRSDN